MLAVHNHETQSKIKKMRIYIAGLTGLGIEVVKNLILVGPKQISIFDEKMTSIEDVGRNFYLREEDVNKNKRLIASL